MKVKANLASAEVSYELEASLAQAEAEVGAVAKVDQKFCFCGYLCN